MLRAFYLELRANAPAADGAPITTRQLESLVRLTEARARADLRATATRRALRALRPAPTTRSGWGPAVHVPCQPKTTCMLTPVPQRSHPDKGAEARSTSLHPRDGGLGVAQPTSALRRACG